MRAPRSMLGGLALAAALATPGIAVGDAGARESLITLAAATIHVTPDRIAEIPVYLQSCSDANACLAPTALYDRAGRRLTQTAPAAFLPAPGDGGFPGLRLTPAAWRALQRSHRLAARLIVKFPGGSTQLLAYETLLPPARGQAPWCSGLLRLVPPCRGRFR